MKTLISYVAFLVVYNFLFWHEQLGINLFLFGAAGIFYSYKTKPKGSLKPQQWLMLLLTLGSGISFLIFNTLLSKWMFLLGIIGLHLSLQTGAIALFENLLNGILNFLNPKGGLIPHLGFKKNHTVGRFKTIIRIAIIPILIFSLYFILFSFGNQIFGELSIDFLNGIAEFFERFFSLTYILFLFSGIVIIRWIYRKSWFSIIRIPLENSLLRKTGEKKIFKNLDLKYEYLTAIGVFGLLNLLFALVNFIDVKNVWFQFDINEVESLKSFVHEGVGWLIFSLLVSMGIILFYFRGNLNFYPKSTLLKRLAFSWIIQNMILAISVLCRTVHYIQYHGIASKRIGVFIFVVIVFLGLSSLFYKLKEKKNYGFFIKWNSLSAFAVLSIAAFLPWDTITAKFNLNHKVVHQIDVNNYLNSSPQVYPILYDNLEKIETQILNHQNNQVRWIGYQNLEEFKRDLDEQTLVYLKERRLLGFPSWTWADQQNLKKLKSQLEVE